MGLRSYVIKRVVYTIFLIIIVITLNFVIFDLMPGDPMQSFLGGARIRDQETRDAIVARFGLDQPTEVRYVRYLENMLTFNFGVSFASQKPISEEIGERLANTFLLVGLSTIFAIIIGIILGVYAAYKRGGTFDTASVVTSLTFYSLPSFWLGMIFLLIFGVYLGWFPLAGVQPRDWQNPSVWPTPPQWPQDWPVIIAGRLRHLFLPVLTLTLFQFGGYLLLTRAVMLESLTDDYVLTARAKGLKERTVLFRHALKNASLPLITNIALSFGFLLTGAIITEQVFTWRGLGWWIWNSIAFTDYPALQAIFYIIALSVVFANFLADLVYGIIDPRVKY